MRDFQEIQGVAAPSTTNTAQDALASVLIRTETRRRLACPDRAAALADPESGEGVH